MNYTIIQNPYKDESTIVTTRGVMTDAKVAKLNNDKKRPALVNNWERLRPEDVVVSTVSTPKDYSSLLDSIGISVVNYSVESSNSGAKKLRVNTIVNEKARNIYNNTTKKDVIPVKEEPTVPIVEEKEIKIESALTPNFVNNANDSRGRHEKEAVVTDIKQDASPVNSTISYASRTERNVLSDIVSKPEIKQEARAGDMDLYNNLLHNASETDDVSRQLQGARNQLSIEKEESRKLAVQYGEAVKELAKLKEDIETTKKQKEQKVKEELSITLKSIENLQKENLERTSDLSSIQSEIARLRAEKQAMEASSFE